MTNVMNPRRIAGIFHAHPLLRERDVGQLIGLGVRPEVLRQQPSPLHVGHVAWLAPRHFEFEQYLSECDANIESERALLILVIGYDDQPVDLAAWAPSTGRLAVWLGRAWALGQHTAYLPRTDPQDGLLIWRNPLHWIGARQRGLVLLEHHRAAEHLSDAGPLLAEDVEHGQELRKVLTRPAPRILIPTASLFRRAA